MGDGKTVSYKILYGSKKVLFWYLQVEYIYECVLKIASKSINLIVKERELTEIPFFQDKKTHF